jgi:DNA-binding CsgD family transcriptional regulator
MMGDTGALLERELEVAELGAAVLRAKAGFGGTVLVEGPAGIGKSELLAAARGLAAKAGMRVLSGRGAELEHEFAHGVTRQLFEPLLVRAAPEDRRRLLAGAARLCQPIFEPETLVVPPPDAFATLHGLYWLAVNASDSTPLLLAVDDLHWSDRPSVQFLEYLAGRLDGLPVLVVAALRPAEAGAETLGFSTLVPARIEPRPLSEHGSAQLVRRELAEDADPAFCRSCHAASGGNPLLLTELLRTLAREGIPATERSSRAILELGSKAVSRTVQARLGKLAPEVVRFAKAAAVLGDDAAFRDAAALADLSAEAAYEAIAALYQLGILRREPRIEFVHPLVRAAIYDDLAPGERQRAHARAARTLVDAGGSPEHVAAHLLLVAPGADPDVVEILRGAARRALAKGGAGVAAAYLRRALEEQAPDAERADVLFELGSAEVLTDGAAAVDHLSEALGLVSDPSRRAVIAGILAHALVFADRPHEAVATARGAIDQIGDRDPALRRRLEVIVHQATSVEPSLRAVGEELSARVRAGPDGDDVGAKALLANVAYLDARAFSSAAEAVTRAQRALAGGVLLAEDNGGAAWIGAGTVLAMADSDLALPTFSAGIEAASVRGNIFAFAANKIFRCQAHLMRGDLAAAIADGAEALEATFTAGIEVGPRQAAAYFADALMEHGDLDGAERALARASTRTEVPDSWTWHAFFDTRSRLRILRGDLRGGLAETIECGRRIEAIGLHNPAWIAWRSRAALCLTQLGEDPGRARRLIDEELRLARRWGAPRALGAALRARGLVLGGGDGVNSLREAVDVLDASPARLELARALTDLGATLRRAGQRATAREPLIRGLEIAHRCGAMPLAERARAELRAAGARPRSFHRTGAESLTPSERRVADMAAQGLTTREIAQQLFVTPKTIEVHLTNSFRKLGISSRQELRSALSRDE